MSIIFHPSTNLPIGDPELVPLSRRDLPSPEDMELELRSLILSPSGWRKVFAAPDQAAERAVWAKPRAPAIAVEIAAPKSESALVGLAAVSQAGARDEDSLGERVAPVDLVIAGVMALAFGDFLVEFGGRSGHGGRRDPALLVGIDSRPTGPALADLMIRVWLARGLRPRHLFIVAAPEIMAYSRRVTCLEAGHEERAEGFCYVSASHNPPGHNGLKFGVGGGVLPVAEANGLAARFRTLIAEPGIARRVFALVDEAEPRAVAAVYTAAQAWKRRSASAYTLFAREVVTGRAGLEEQEALLEEMAATAKRRPVGIVAEFNGSARCLSIDADFLGGLGLRVSTVNDRPRAFAHRIVPEGASLEPARLALATAHRGDAAFVAGYVPDCDGDRGNLVFWNRLRGDAAVLGAQEVFALAVLAELALLVREGKLLSGEDGRVPNRVAVVVNDATSLRIDSIAAAFGAEVHRAETGEANVVGLAAALRAEGVLVRILGEGSNGGNITFPSEVRDPLATLGALLKLLLLRDAKGSGEGLYHIWLRLTDRLVLYRPDFDLGDILASLPAWVTTSVFEDRAALRITETDQVALKGRYRSIFLREWESRKAELASRFAIAGWRAFASLGSGEREIGGDFEASARGGLRLAFVGVDGRPRGFLWMRGSGTEPVFRIMADLEGGSDADEAWLLAWQTAMVREADLR